VQQLLDRGLAYWDYASAEDLKAEREAAEREKQSFVYSRRWMARTAAERDRFQAEGRSGVVRLQMPRSGACRFSDHIRGDVSVEWATEQDHVIQRADGTVLYNLANVVDDFDMEISHVIRAEEHLANTPRQIFMLEGLGYPRPEYAHVPFVAEPGSKNKLSKRKIAQYFKNADFKKVYEQGKAIADRLALPTAPESFNPVLVEFYEQVGYLPDAIVNYLLLLGWAHEDGKSEFFSRDEMVHLFSLDRVNKGPASFDAKKLLAFQERYMQELPVERKVDLALPYLARAGLSGAVSEPRGTVTRIVEAAGPRIKVSGDILDYDDFFQPEDRLVYDEQAVEKCVRKPPGADWIGPLREIMAAAEPFDAASLKRSVEQFIQARGLKPIPVTQALRVAVTGKEVGFGVYETLEILGRERCLARIDRARAL
jgi:glutamyl-tRNA synthetase